MDQGAQRVGAGAAFGPKELRVKLRSGERKTALRDAGFGRHLGWVGDQKALSGGREQLGVHLGLLGESPGDPQPWKLSLGLNSCSPITPQVGSVLTHRLHPEPLELSSPE